MAAKKKAIYVEVSEDFHKLVKTGAARRGKTITELVVAALRRFLAQPS